jgi:hypothetical protein
VTDLIARPINAIEQRRLSMKLATDKFEDGLWYVVDADLLKSVPEHKRHDDVREGCPGFKTEQEALDAIRAAEEHEEYRRARSPDHPFTRQDAEYLIGRGVCPITPYTYDHACAAPCYCRVASRTELESKGLLPRWITELDPKYDSVAICLKDEHILTPVTTAQTN